MFNPNNYHWTEDLCTEEGVFLLREYLQKEGISLKIINASIHRSQRMGKKKIRFDISASLGKDGKDYVIADYTSMSAPEDIEESPVKSCFFLAIQNMKDTLNSTENNASSTSNTEKKTVSKLELPTLSNSSIAKIESYKCKFTLSSNIERVKDILFNSQTIQSWGVVGGISVAYNGDKVSYQHQLFSFKNMSYLDFSKKGSYSLRGTATIPDALSFPLTISLSSIEPDTTRLTLSSSEAPVNTSSKITSLFSSVYLTPMRAVFGITFS